MDSFTVITIVTWFSGLWLVGWLVLPLARLVFGNLPDGGLAAGRVLAIALLSLLALWLAVCHLVPLSLAPWGFAGLPLLGWLAMVARPAPRRAFLEFVRGRRWSLVLSDAVFAAIFVGFLWVRLRHPEINDLEKPMDAAIMGGLLHARFLPATNPWFSGVPFTNYYYFGHLMGALLARCFATPLAYAYNLVVPTFCALFVSTLWPLCAALTGSPRRGLLATAVVALLGHFEPLLQWAQNGVSQPLSGWDTSRVIPNTINEYPLFTMTIGDAHAHFFALALAALFFSLCWALFHQEDAPPAPATRHRHGVLLLLGVLLGIFIMTNTWDAPTYAGLGLLCGFLTRRAHRGAGRREIAWNLLPLLLAPLTALPYLITFKAQVSGIQHELWPPPGMPFLLLWGGFLTLWLLSLAWFDTGQSHRRLPILLTLALLPVAELARWLLLAVAGRAFAAQAAAYWLDMAALPVTAGALFLSYGWLQGLMSAQPTLAPTATEVTKPQPRQPKKSAASTASAPDAAATNLTPDAARWLFMALLGIVGLVTLLAPMGYYLRGVFGDGDLRHQDTVFKYTLQGWLLLGSGAACMAIALWSQPRAARWRLPAAAVFCVLWAVPVLCAAAVVNERAIAGMTLDANGDAALSLDGARFLPPNDRAAIDWLDTHGQEGDVVLEGVGQEYKFSSYNEFGRVAALSGMPSTLGWTQHVAGWNKALDVAARWNQVHSIYTWADSAASLGMLRQLNVRYVFIGALERRDYDPRALERMQQALPVAYARGDTVILRVPAN